MGGFFGFIKSAIIWIFLIGFFSGAYLGGQFTSYFDYISNVKHATELKTPAYKLKYSSNIFYKLDEWSNPEDFKDVNEYKIKDRK